MHGNKLQAWMVALAGAVILCSDTGAQDAVTSTNQPKRVLAVKLEDQGKAVQAPARKADFGPPPGKKGIVIESPVAIRNPLQLLNPFAPAKYGTAAVVRDPITGEVRGVSLVGASY
jgi:hypothetical protein